MTTKRKILTTLFLCVAALIVLPTTLFRMRYCRTVVVRDLSVASTQTVSVAFRPAHISWKISGSVQGTGTVFVPYVFSNTVSGGFSAQGEGDCYDTNIAVVFIPQGQASGQVRGSFFLHDFY